MGWLKLLLRFALEGLQGQRGRSLLTMIGMGIGTASVVVVVSIGLVGRDYVVSLIEGVGSNLVFAYGTGIGPTPTELSFEDLELMQKRVRGVAAMAPVLKDASNVPIRGESRVISVLGSTADYAPVRNLKMMQGRFFTDAEDRGYAKVCVISKELWISWFTSANLRDNLHSFTHFFVLAFSGQSAAGAAYRSTGASKQRLHHI